MNTVFFTLLGVGAGVVLGLLLWYVLYLIEEHRRSKIITLRPRWTVTTQEDISINVKKQLLKILAQEITSENAGSFLMAAALQKKLEPRKVKNLLEKFNKSKE